MTCTERTALPLYVVVEKILGADETLPEDWLLAGTTGYDFLNSVAGLFVDPAGLAELSKIYGRFIDERLDFREVAQQSKRQIFRASMSSELQLLAHRLNRISQRHRRSRDFTLNTLRTALREILACFSVYRTYIREGYVSERDRQAVCRARRRPSGVIPLRMPPSSISFATCSCWSARPIWTRPAAASGNCSWARAAGRPAP